MIAVAFCGADDPADPDLQEQLRECVAAFPERLQSDSDDFELRHSLLVAIGLIAGELPRSGTGK
ncbi:MAG: hypothetical protein ACKON9_03575, partial [Planctomycetaceae bacterium]